MTAALASPTLVTPASVAELHDCLRQPESRWQFRGAGTWRDAGAPVDATHQLSLRGLSGIIAYVPGDLTITAFAGTSLAELSQATAAHGQWLALDPPGDRHGTIGATIATASAGPLSHAFGTPRDLVLGLDAITGYGDVVKPGGRVVKNVAGFDLVRLYTGSWGTLGPITSVTMRLRAIPVHDVTLAMPVPAEPSRLEPVLTALRQQTLSLLACEWLDGATARRLGVGTGDDMLLIRVGGNDGFVRGQRAALERIGETVPCAPAIWGLLADLDRDAGAVVRFSGPVAGVAARIARLRAVSHDASRMSVHASVARGIVRVVLHGDAEPERGALQSCATGEQRIPERLPRQWWSDEADPFDGGLAGRIRRAFDPDLRCNRRATIDA
jgi:FAD/FMN-containing dehydrogenase